MEDIIFAGTQKRKPQAFAEVSLLLDNALEYSPEGGEISLTAHPVEKLRLLSPIQWTQRSI